MDTPILPDQNFFYGLDLPPEITVEKAFENFLNNEVDCKLTKVEQVVKSHNNLRKILQSKIENDDKFPWLLYNKDFVSGSAGRGTRIDPPNDIDLMLPLDGTGLRPFENGVFLDSTVEGSGYYGSPVQELTNEYGFISSHKVLEQIKSSLKSSFPNSEIRRDGQAITINFGSYFGSDGLNFDLVPCFHVIPNNKLITSYYYIPIGYGDHYWKKTNPLVDSFICDKLDEANNFKIKPTIRLIKKWNELINPVPLASYHLDVICWKVFNSSNTKLLSLSAAASNFFFNAEKHLSVSCPDYTGLNNEAIDRYLTPDNRKKALSSIQEAKSNIMSALIAEIFSKNNSLAIDFWKKVFGEKFGG